MKEGIKLFRVFGIEISLDFSWFIVFFLVSWSLASGYFPLQYPMLATGTYWIMGLFSSLLLFITVLMHELSHSIVANSNGLNIRGIKLFIFGGVAQLAKEPHSARVEFDVAIAGPICSFLLHFIFKGAASGLSIIFQDSVKNPVIAILGYLAFINLFLGIINLIPAFPLDGGRILRAFIWARTNSLRKATAVASSAGKFFAMFLIFLGFMATIRGELAGLWYVFIGIFLFSAAKMGYENVIIRDALTESFIRDVMTTNVVTIDSSMTLDRTVEDYFFRYHHNSFPVIEDGRIKGLLDLAFIKQVPREKWAQTTAGSIAHPVEPHAVVTPRERTSTALSRLAQFEMRYLVVMNEGVLAGIVTRHDIMKLLKMKMDLNV